MENFILRNAQLVNEGKLEFADVLIKNGRIERIRPVLNSGRLRVTEINCEKLHLLPGLIDDQVHFREPGLTSKGDIFHESRAAAAGGITSFMEMPNTIPNALSQEILAEKYEIAKDTSLVNYSFYMGVSNSNSEEVLKTDLSQVCGVKIFLGSSTGNMLVDNPETLEKIFTESQGLIAVHCEDEQTIADNLQQAKEKYGTKIPAWEHANIRSTQACYISSSKAFELAKKHNTRLHILHISTAKELALFDKNLPVTEKRITSEACIHHLWFNQNDYERLGNRLKWNPSVKTEEDRKALLSGLLDGSIDVIATDHAPHLLEEKDRPYLESSSGGPMVQHALVALLELFHRGEFTLEAIVQKTAHNVAECFKIAERGYIREGYKADLVLVDLHNAWKVSSDNILYKCAWSPLDKQEFQSKIISTFVNGVLVYTCGEVIERSAAERISFNR